MLKPASRIVFVRTLALAMTVAAVPAHAAFDHLQCFKIKDNSAPATYTADINPLDATFVAAPPGCEIKVPAKLLCVDAEKTNVAPTPPGAADGASAQPYLCYKAKCTKVQPSTSVTDQFGVHSIVVKSTKMVCAPVPGCSDVDSDTYTDCAGDCNDSNASVNPGAIEICNGFDDNCNAAIDESDPSVGGVCFITNGSGSCAGVTTCTAGALVCSGPTPAPETCDSADNNCDGNTDEGNPGGGFMCSTGQPGICANGTTTCTSGSIVCTPNVSATSETCNGADDDCNGIVDNGNPGGGAPCNTGMLGICAIGTTSCTSGSIVCTQNSMPMSETCNGLDDDCNGITDNGNPGGGFACSTGLLGVCSQGTTSCSGGAVVCQQNTSPSTEVCDGLDNNCNGSTDEGCLANGSACSSNGSCLSTQCVDGVCCNTACTSLCQACTATKKGSGSDGTCGNIAVSTDPDSECTGTQTCNGSGACQP
jgi:hypothetical protein